MRAAVLRSGRIVVRPDVPDPRPGPGQVLVRVRACGICGSDLHFARHGGRMLALGREVEGTPSGSSDPVDLDRDVFMGHEFAAEVLELGPGAAEHTAVGALVTSVPVLLAEGGVAPIVYSNTVHGGYGELMLLSAPLLLDVPNGLPPHHAALAEPMAVGLHAVNKSAIRRGEGAVVLGCGPVGLAVIAALRARGAEPIVASDFSPARRDLAAVLGAHRTVDPREETAWSAWAREDGRQLVAFDAIGVPGVINDVLRSAPRGTRLVVVGVCMGTDSIDPYFGITKELSLQFVLGYDAAEFERSLRSIAEGEIDVAPLVTARVPLDRISWAFDALDDPDRHCKIIVEP
ncbi:zinc-binding dehydrogenase [Saccharopolyspora sp. CA-218241]|uniref:zinc-binding dehydrogenase n=1 Tax=Saccharopolyspora sp. CA-218241 TaxID=3240027 RepID=UPI003D953294